MRCVGYKPLARGSLQGFADIAMDSGLVLLGCGLHESNGKRWVNPPSRPQLDAARKPMLGNDGKLLYAPIVDFVDKKMRFRWSDEAVKAVAAYLDSKEPAAAGSMNNDRVTPERANARSPDG